MTNLIQKYLTEASADKTDKKAIDAIKKISGIKVMNVKKRVNVSFILKEKLDDTKLENMKVVDDIEKALQKIYGREAMVGFNGNRTFRVEEM